MEEVVARENLQRALKRVKQNKGSPGVDGMRVDQLPDHLREHWPSLRAQLLEGRYRPQPVKRQMIPKPGGGERMLGIPTVLDRFIQQAILQVLQPRFDPTFSEHAYGFRPGRRAQDAILAAQRYVEGGRHFVVDIDLEKFFDRVNHDVLMGRLAKRIADKRMLALSRRYLEAGIMANGVAVERHEGTPQGGPLSPLLANVLLDEVDKELERRGHAFCRYADDCNVYVRSKRAGERVMQALKRHYARLRLRINETKSAVAEPWGRPFLGYTFWRNRHGEVRRAVAEKALTAARARIRLITCRNGGRRMGTLVEELKTFLVGWKEYFRLVQVQRPLRDLDKWVRRRLRAAQLTQWKRGTTVYRELRARGVPMRRAQEAAAHATRWWRTAAHAALQEALPIRYYDRLGIPRLAT
nr:group II intron reverse transcriptase/maturase [Sulfurifustis variabilis]